MPQPQSCPPRGVGTLFTKDRLPPQGRAPANPGLSRVDFTPPPCKEQPNPREVEWGRRDTASERWLAACVTGGREAVASLVAVVMLLKWKKPGGASGGWSPEPGGAALGQRLPPALRLFSRCAVRSVTVPANLGPSMPSLLYGTHPRCQGGDRLWADTPWVPVTPGSSRHLGPSAASSPAPSWGFRGLSNFFPVCLILCPARTGDCRDLPIPCSASENGAHPRPPSLGTGYGFP